jgi:hypothetical protein
MAEHDEGTSEMKHAGFSRECSKRVTNRRKFWSQRKQPLDLPAAAIAAQGPAILSQRSAVAAVRCDHFYTGLRQLTIQPVGVVSIVANQALDWFGWRRHIDV